MTLQEEIEGLFIVYSLSDKMEAIIEYVYQKKEKLEKNKERCEETKEYLILKGIEDNLMFIYMLEMSLMRFKQELSIMTQEALDHIEIKEIKKPTSQSLATEEVSNHSESY